MRNDTPPHSSFEVDPEDPVDPNNDDDAPNLEAESDDELVYLGDADEVLDRWEAEANAGAADDDDDDEFLQPIDEDGEGADDDDRHDGPQRDDASVTFDKHIGSVFCCSFHPTLDVACTGGEDDQAYVWSTLTGDVVHEITSHHDTVIAAAFSPDGNYLAIGDMAGEVEVLKLSQGYKKVWEFSMGDMVWMQWHCATNVLMAGAEAGDVYVWRIPSGDCKVLAGNGQRSECASLTADGKRLIVGYADGAVRLWDIKSSTCVLHIEAESPLAHTDAVTCIAADPDNGLWLSGSQDGNVLISCASGAMTQLHPAAGAVEQLAFCGEAELKLVACGTLEGNISLWDVAKQAVRVECERSPVPSGVSKMLWAPGQNLVCATLSGAVKVFDGRTGALKRTLEGHRSDIYDMCYSKEKQLLMTVSDDGTAKLYGAVLE